MTGVDTNGRSYEPPELRVMGTLHELTLGDWCFFEKTLGSPDYWLRIPAPIANCST
jgi:hypothetical protein